MEAKIKAATSKEDKAHFISYADDFVITGSTREILEDTVKPLISEFLKERGLELSAEKTIITHINKGFDFLGFNVRKYKQKLLIKPCNKNVTTFLSNIRKTIKTTLTARCQHLIYMLNMKIRGWANYYRHAVSKVIFKKVDHNIFEALWKWAKRRHPNKSLTWVKNKYFLKVGNNNWTFSAGILVPYKGRAKLLTLLRTSSITIVRHIKIQSDANLYDPKYKAYFEKREMRKRHKSYKVEGIAGSI